MARELNKLTAAMVKGAKPRKKLYRLADGGGLMLTIMPNGTKYWHFRFRTRGKEQLVSFGPARELSLAEAREKRKEARAGLRNGLTPQATRQINAAAQRDTFKSLAMEWYERKSATWSNKKHRQNILASLENDVFPQIGDKPVREITARDILDTVQLIVDRGSTDTASRTLQRIGSVMKLGVVLRMIENSPADGLSEWVSVPRGGHLPALQPAELGTLLHTLDSPESLKSALRPVTILAIELQMLTVLRPGELCHGEWTEIDLDAATWTIAAAKMKMSRPHIVPLSQQALVAIRELYQRTGNNRWMFPGTRGAATMSGQTVNQAIKRLGFGGRHCAHGFRTTFSTWANESTSFSEDVIEYQLAHIPANKVRAAYNRAKYFDDRKRLMQAWADFTDTTRGISGKITPKSCTAT